MTYNVKKTVCMCIKPKQMKTLRVPKVVLNGNTLTWTNKHKYLGVIIKDNKSDSEDISRELRAIYARGNLILRKFHKCAIDVKIYIFKTYFSNCYCNQLWCNYILQDLTKVKTAFNNIFRLLMRIPRAPGISISKECVFMNICSFDVSMRKSSASFRQRLFRSKNCLIMNVTGSHFFMFSSSINIYIYILCIYIYISD